MNLVLGCILLYVAVQLALGMAVSRWIATEDDYLLAGRRLGCWLGTFTIFATWFGAESCIGAAGRIYVDGLSGGSADPFGYTLGILFMGLVFAVPLWNRRLTTIADLYRLRYSPNVERLVVVLMIPTSVLWAAAQVRAFGQVLTASSDMPIAVGITVAAVVVIAYTVAGGLFADAVTDLLQGVVMILGLFAVLWFLITHYGDTMATWSAIPPERLRLFSGGTKPTIEIVNAWLIPIVGSVVAQELISRTLAIQSAMLARRCCLLAAVIYLAVGMIPVTIGLIGGPLVGEIDAANADRFLPEVAEMLLPTWIYILFAGALVSAILSTVDSALLVAGSLAGHNLLRSLIPTTSERTKLRVTRLCVGGFGLVAYCIALLSDKTSIELVLEAAQLGSAGLFVVQVFGLFSRFGGAVTAMLTLVSATGVWLVSHYAFHSGIAFVISLIVAIACYLAVGSVDPPAPSATSYAAAAQPNSIASSPS